MDYFKFSLFIKVKNETGRDKMVGVIYRPPENNLIFVIRKLKFYWHNIHDQAMKRFWLEITDSIY